MGDSAPSTYLHIRSEERKNGDSSYFTVSLNDTVKCPKKYTMFLSLSNIALPYTFTQIDKYNNQFKLRLPPANLLDPYTYYDIIIPYGNYSAADLASTLKLLMDTQLGSNQNKITCTANRSTGKITFTRTGAAFALIFDHDFRTHELFGFEKSATLTTTAIESNSNIIETNIMDLVPRKTVIVRIPSVTSNSIIESSKSSSHDILAEVGLENRIPFSLISIDPSHKNSIMIKNRHINELTLRLTFENGDPVDLNKKEWDCVIRVDYRKIDPTFYEL